MVTRIEKDHRRFRRIVRGQIKKELRRYISSGEMIGRQGGRSVKIPVPSIELPHFTFDTGQQGGVGRGEGQPGDPADAQEGEGQGEAGEQPGEHELEVEVGLDELAQILGEELELPNIQPRGEAQVIAEKDRFTGIHRIGPESLRHFKRTYREALKRQIASGLYDPDDPVIIPIKDDRRYRAWETVRRPESKAVIIYMMDISGSMGTEQKEIVRIEAFWIDTWLQYQYKNLSTVYIVHDAAAREVDQHAFFHLRESGGTKISSAYELALEIIDDRFAGGDWNIYPFHFSDGDNWSGKDTAHCIQLMKERLLPISNMMCYGQVKSAYGSGQFKRDLDAAFPDEPRLITSAILDREGILESIREFLGKGR